MQRERQSKIELHPFDTPLFIMMRPDFLERMFDSLIRVYHSAAYPIILTMGKESGAEEVKLMREEYLRINESYTKNELLDLVLDRFAKLGWGRISVDKLTTQDKGVKIDVSFNSLIQECGAETKGGCVFLQGLLSGIASEVMEEEMDPGVPRCERTPEGTCSLHLVNTNQ